MIIGHPVSTVFDADQMLPCQQDRTPYGEYMTGSGKNGMAEIL